ncbi:MAG: hypothetical protein PHN37_02985, partial [Candidatus Pacebacteria bacterium]|nr:hypothetical protein [Candidatus Paceibacterota bacterium]
PRGDRFQDKRENSFGNRNTDTLKKDNQYKEQLDQLIAKLDVIINMLAVKGQEKEKVKKPSKKKLVSKKN